MTITCLGLYLVPSSLACHVLFMVYSILFLRCFIFYLSFIFLFILNPSCILSLFISSVLYLIPLASFVSSRQKGGEYTGVYTEVYRHFYITHVHTLRGRNFISCTFVRGESRRGDAYTKREKTFFYEKTLFLFVFLYICFLIALCCFELHLVFMIYCSHLIVFLCWTCIYPYAIVFC